MCREPSRSVAFWVARAVGSMLTCMFSAFALHSMMLTCRGPAAGEAAADCYVCLAHHTRCAVCLQDEANELERELLQELFRHLLLEAGQVYKQRQQDGWHDEDTPAADHAAWDAAAAAGEADSEEEDSDLEEGESDDETEAAHKAALRRAKQRRSWKPSKGEVLMILVGMMLLGELFVMLDMLGLFNRRR